jgi:hypothetical protein
MCLHDHTHANAINFTHQALQLVQIDSRAWERGYGPGKEGGNIYPPFPCAQYMNRKGTVDVVSIEPRGGHASTKLSAFTSTGEVSKACSS